ncbi:hypothetical protein OV450_3447 [Actinobacteria bacterium OV450]|nr:hypothetical protein OV450_3447 [Actinobacteria bacterium OV450]
MIAGDAEAAEACMVRHLGHGGSPRAPGRHEPAGRAPGGPRPRRPAA